MKGRDDTMTVKELMNVLEGCDENAKVYVQNSSSLLKRELLDEEVYHVTGEGNEKYQIIIWLRN